VICCDSPSKPVTYPYYPEYNYKIKYHRVWNPVTSEDKSLGFTSSSAQKTNYRIHYEQC
jgi:hypothetical protein